MSTRTVPVAGRGIGVALATVVLAGSAASAYVPTYRTVALSGTLSGSNVQYGPGAGTLTTFGALDGQPSINFAGQVAFRAQDPAGTIQGLWVSNGLPTNVNSVQALGGQAQPGGGTYTTGTSTINAPWINNAGNLAFRLGSASGLFSNTGSGMSRIALAGDIAPGTGNATYAASAVASGTPLFNQAGQTGYLGTLTTGSGTPAVSITSPNANQTCLYIGTGSNAGGANPNVTLALRATDIPAPLAAIDSAAGGTGTGLKIGGNFAAGTMSFNDSNRYVVVNTFQGTIGGVAVATASATGNANSLISNRSGSFEIIARQGTVAPDAAGLTTGTNLYRTLPTSAITGFNNMGHVAYTATLRNAAGTQTSTGALFTDQGTGVLRMYANIGGALPQVYSPAGAALTEFNGVNWGAMTGTPLLTGSDQMIFSASSLTGTGITLNGNDSGLFRLESNGNLTKLLRAGDAIPVITPLGTGEFCKLSGMPSTGSACNSLGQIAWSGIVNSNLGTAGNVNGALGNNSALWATDVDGTAYCIAQKGELFHVGPGDDRVVLAINGVTSSGGQDGRALSFNDNGDLTFSLTFGVTGNATSGVFVVHVPTPGSLALLGLGGLIAARRKRA